MKPWLLDTNILSELRRSRPDSRVLAFVHSCPLDELYLSSVTLAEIRFGVESAVDLDRRGELEVWLSTIIRPMFERRVLQITEDVVLRWRVLVERGRKTGRTFPQPDLLIAATALQWGMTLVTRNVKDFAGTGATIFNPWEQE